MISEAASTDRAGAGSAPCFSVIVPMYNRAHTIGRCLDSCLGQSFLDHEIIVVDDGSDRDDSVALVESYTDPRVRLIRSQENRGVCAARGLGVEHARGQWLVFIDSDDSFHAGALETIHRHCVRAPEDVGEVRFRYWSEALGKVTPYPAPPLGVIGFREYLEWLDIVVNSDVLYCQRRTIYERVSWPTDRRFETMFHLDVAAHFRMLVTDEVVGTMHDDARNRLTKPAPGPIGPRALQSAWDNALASQEILDRYGAALIRHCPRWYWRLRRMVGDLYLRAGCRARGSRAMLRYLGRRPFDAAGWGLLLFGLLGPRTLHRAIRWVRADREKSA